MRRESGISRDVGMSKAGKCQDNSEFFRGYEMDSNSFGKARGELPNEENMTVIVENPLTFTQKSLKKRTQARSLPLFLHATNT